MEDSDFLTELRQMVALSRDAMGLVDVMAFVNVVANRLDEDPVFGEYIYAEDRIEFKRKQLKIHGYSELDESDGTVSLVIGDWDPGLEPATIPAAEVDRLKELLANFVSASIAGGLDAHLNESTPQYHIASTLRRRKDDISCVRLHIFTNRNISQKYKRESREAVSGVPVEVHIWDLQRLKAIFASEREREMVVINLKDFGSAGIPCIKASIAEDLQSYLCVIEGGLLADLFERYAGRLLEGNVRSFLGMKGAVNKGIRATIQDSPPRFFAYNNGIAATALEVVVSDVDGTPKITGISDLQIVNGGQTTASILRARKQERLSLSGVTVPMKLTVVSREKSHELIPRIAEYANTQNKVAIADFFANHPFHIKMEETSRRLLVPARAGTRVQSKWFYERSRGQYQNERLYLSTARKSAHDLEYPPKQVINKTELAKYHNTLSMKPYWVALGAQKNFMKFAGIFSSKSDKSEAEHWNDIGAEYGDAYYRKIVGMAIMWAAGEKVVSDGRGDWYLGDYRPQIVSYAWAFIFHQIKAVGRVMNFEYAWKIQSIDDELSESFKLAAITAQEVLLNPPPGSRNVGEWAKKEACWNAMLEYETEIEDILEQWSIDAQEERQNRADNRRQGRQDNQISVQAMVFEAAQSGYWASLAAWQNAPGLLTPREIDLVRRASSVRSVASTNERDWDKLNKIKIKCEEDGFRFNI